MSRLWVRSLSFLTGGVALGVSCLLFQGPLPGDLAITHALQGALGTAPNWAAFVTSTAKSPLVLALRQALGRPRTASPIVRAQ